MLKYKLPENQCFLPLLYIQKNFTAEAIFKTFHQQGPSITWPDLMIKCKNEIRNQAISLRQQYITSLVFEPIPLTPFRLFVKMYYSSFKGLKKESIFTKLQEYWNQMKGNHVGLYLKEIS